ncbi:MAG: branched-chain amino acid ABC transporter permease [Christensenella sp.]|nr:branched-chain amino acid ABC transporter permease [Christensenella sp.]
MRQTSEAKMKLNNTAGRQTGRTKLTVYIVVLAILAITPAFMSSYLQIIMTKFVIMALFAVGYDLIFGYLGLLSLGHAAFFGMGGYVVGVMALHYGSSNFWLALIIGIVLAVITAALFGLISLRFKGVYFLLITFALGQLLYAVAWNVGWLNTPGMQGIAGITWPDLGFFIEWTQQNFYYLVLIVFVIGYFILSKIVNSPYGHVLVGIREGEPRMKALGYNTYAYKYTAYLISGGFAGVAGVLFAFSNNMITPAHFALDYSFLPMAMAIIGSRGTLYGPVVGAGILVFAEYFISQVVPERWPLFLGIIFICSIMFLRKGVTTSIIDAIKKRSQKRKQVDSI